MQKVKTRLPIFPLPVFILPGGITRLRIFEPRYLKMVKIATQEQGFVIWLNSIESEDSDAINTKAENPDLKTMEPKEPDTLWGSWVEIINFDQGDDGILEIDVQCKSLVNILSSDQDEDDLHFGVVSERSHWSQEIEQSTTDTLSQSLDNVFDSNTMLNKLYVEKATHNANWVVARWLELIPVDLAIKTSFVHSHSYEEAKGFVQSIIFNE
ncbi:LON peptidase substrate-binding domain-containing protein [Colwellia sp. 1_MG-2023]|jgi:Lon protease-like protein|uniref:LON peptidase substrate-binding domain-containing protein n=1 Tax=unclassified Colwellia TaxID=196834 RepID=UPI001C094D3C|nr:MULTISPECIES: LON peptidase substrate-binding domain-containing protein [unclassified Colwellia]MBU2925886.1 LON peptidase substrate-binding domain-containing protein [Colwellia sp. C2M11]MDO6489166.1 LON peptidase substrate-binding domain-containing protein [Colwellia sp. 6_MG-2023]MDO6652716.1 LON peptidase substrate-binding domain-containing protein [Colwellia sp. 3_MG-2023]MDO6665591.1 LON peptidase substrate-binding domain-containing protein [Colwellia sp. 2_MG-2023]MDO6689964.1 LON pe